MQFGELGEEASSQFDRLLQTGVSPDHISASYIASAIARKNLRLAAVLVEAWERDSPNHPHAVFLRGVLCAQSDDNAGAHGL